MPEKEGRQSLNENNLDLSEVAVIEVGAYPTPKEVSSTLTELEDGRREMRIDFELRDVRVGDGDLALKVRSEVTTRSTTALVMIAMAFRAVDPKLNVEMEEAELEAFISNVAFPNLLPYVRANIYSLFALIGQRAPNFPILRPGQISAQLKKSDSVATDA